MRFRAIADADPNALVCILDGPYECFQRMLAKIDEMPVVIAAVAFDADWTHTVAQA